ncbi:MAG: hypothetical protein JWQ25_488, partial [Daejeonella sp.]|nr:hypothetical protein [Daejeonella sp.]
PHSINEIPINEITQNKESHNEIRYGFILFIEIISIPKPPQI